MQRFSNPYVRFLDSGCVIDGGVLIDWLHRDAEKAMAESREAAKRILVWVTEAHAHWLKGHNLTGKKLRNAGTPFTATRNRLEEWLRETDTRKKSSRPKRGYIYFIGIDGTSDVVKIGFAVNVKARLSQLQTASHQKLCLLCALAAERKRESELHNEFSADHIRGEWFHLSANLIDFIERNKSIGASKQ